MTTETISRRQTELITRLREVERDIESLIKRRREIRAELERIYPHARQLTPAPKEQGITLSIYNYGREGYTGHITATAKGKEAFNSLASYLTDADFIILSLCTSRAQGADATKLLAYLTAAHPTINSKRHIDRLHKFAFITLDFTRKVI